MQSFDQLWAALFPAEQMRIVHLLVDRVTVGEGGVAVDLRHEGLGAVILDQTVGGLRMSGAAGTIRVVVPLHVRKRNGRPKILPPDDAQCVENRGQQPHVLRAVARAWNWRQQLESGAASTIQDIAAAEKVSDRFVCRMVRLAYLSPEVLDQLLIQRRPPAVTLNELAEVAERPWAEQIEVTFGA